MKQGIVKFSKEFITPTGLKEWVSLEWEVGEPFDEAKAMEVFMKVKEFVCNSQPNESVYAPGPLTELPVINKDPEEIRIGIQVKDIMSCEDLTTLESYKLLIRGKEDLVEAYGKRRIQLLDKKQR